MASNREFVGPYHLTRLIRAGQRCEIWEAVHTETKKSFAIKMQRPRKRSSKAEFAALRHEYDVRTRLGKNDRIIQIHEFVIENGTPLLVMELFAELNFKQALRRGPESLAPLLDKIVPQAAQAVEQMHNCGWLHRDIRPANFLVSREGNVKLVDLQKATRIRTGLGKLLGSRQGQGTPSVISPEQLRGHACDRLTDIYCFGCMLFELATAQTPSLGLSPAFYNERLSYEFSALIKRTMSERRGDRPTSMEEFLSELGGLNVFRV